MAKKLDVKFGFIMAKRILEQEGCGPLRFAKVVRILKKENPEDGRVRDKVLYWLDVFESSSVINSSYNEEGIKVYTVVDEESLRRLEEEYQKKQAMSLEVSLEEWLVLIKEIKSS